MWITSRSASSTGEFRDKDAATDVLSFPLGENGVYDYNNETGAYMLGDIVISVPRAIEQAQMYGHSLQPGDRLFDRSFDVAPAGL